MRTTSSGGFWPPVSFLLVFYAGGESVPCMTGNGPRGANSLGDAPPRRQMFPARWRGVVDQLVPIGKGAGVPRLAVRLPRS
jgi:hypothetical protein